MTTGYSLNTVYKKMNFRQFFIVDILYINKGEILNMGYEDIGFNTNSANDSLNNALKMIMPMMQKTSENKSSGALPSALSGAMPQMDFSSMLGSFGGYGNGIPDVNSVLLKASAGGNFMGEALKMLAMFMSNTKGMDFNFTPASSAKTTGDTSYFNYDLSGKKALDKFTQEEKDSVVDAAKNIGCDPQDLLAIMNNESGLNPSKWNMAGSDNVGLIQFGGATAKDLGTTTQEISKMSFTQQMTYVEKFYKNAKRMAGISADAKVDGATLYALAFQPKYAGGDVLAKKGTAAYDKFFNHRLDVVGNDNAITKADLQVAVNKQRKALGFESVA